MAQALPRSPARNGANPYLIAALVSFGTLFELLNSTALSVGLNNIAGNLGGTAEESDGIITAYLIANAAVLPLSAWGSKYFGRRRFFLACVALFVIASALCANAWSIESLMFFRVLQGAAAAGNAASETSIIADSFPPEKRGLGFAIYGISVTIGPAFGPILGGYIVDEFSWPLIFWLNVPTGIFVFLALSALIEDKPALKRDTEKARAKGLAIDWTGVALAVVGLAALTFLLDQGQQEDWFDSPTMIVAAVVAVGCLAALPFWELSRKDPILDFRLFANRQFAISILILFMLGVLVIGATSVFPLWLQQSFGYTATVAGLVLCVAAVVAMVPTIPSGILVGKLNTAPMVIVAFSVIAVGLFLTSRVYGDWSFWQLATVWTLQQVSLGFLFVPIQAHSLIGVPGDRTEQVGAFGNLARNLGGSVGTALGLTWVERGRQSYREGLVAETSPYRDEVASAVDQAGGLPAFSAAIDAQATILAYQSFFFVLFVVVLACIPIAMLLRGKPKPDQAAGG